MTPDRLFLWVNQAALVGWLLLLGGVVARRAWWVAGVRRVAPAALGVVYVAVIAATWGSAEGNFNSLAGVRSLFSSDWVLVAGWVHYLAFDLFVGSSMAEEVLRTKRPRAVLIPVLPLTFLFGPAGLVLFELLRSLPPLARTGRRQEASTPAP
jgi:hypothetical protein